jgi:hypothetical protein
LHAHGAQVSDLRETFSATSLLGAVVATHRD